ncbi:EmrB/QacA subfamily drug resistance transporter [Actinomadura pelletieri DSM 43383]|uniref:EmrB/QacA subfamily drug resistance transporter n=1 Tax=Actinomadura pelletieri DSM 43383 TaxID=1120940 RepID=A0A495QIJ7_9ACTN|nr:DHA2 family efflux MFS transporter permease subunit [Actinomadura pelletieri]RKS71949.1 EmrB/QacA subfamily drug resistance transporter [Actinomadura pelletieri DSM 43383]
MSRWRGNPWAILLTLSLGFFMTLLDLTIVNIAIPSMIDKLDASLDQALWVVNAYVLVLAVLLITAGRLGDLWGKKNLFIAGVVVFTLSSLACGLAQDPSQLIAARAVQGFGAALLMPQTLSIIIGVFPPERRGTALGVWGAVAGVSTITGPTLGGLLVTHLDWRWIFFVNLPIGLLVLVMAVPILPGERSGVRHRFDLLGVLLASAALFCLTFALTEGQKHQWNATIWGLIAAGVALLLVFVAYQRTRQDAEPLVPFSLFRDRNFTILSLVGAAVSVGMVGMILPLTIYLQSVLAFSALKAGLVLAPSSVMSMFLAPVAGRLSDRFGGKYILMTGLTLYAAGMLWVATVAEVGTNWTAFVVPLAIAGVGIGCVFAPMATEATRHVPPRLAGAASGVNNTVRQVGSVLGAAAVGAVLQNRLASSLRDEATTRASALPEDVRTGFVRGFADAGKGGLEVGAGQTGTKEQLPAGIPPDVAQRVHELAAQVFSHGFVHAMKPAMLLPIGVMFLSALACLTLRGRRAGPPAGVDAEPEHITT